MIRRVFVGGADSSDLQRICSSFNRCRVLSWWSLCGFPAAMTKCFSFTSCRTKIWCLRSWTSGVQICEGILLFVSSKHCVPVRNSMAKVCVLAVCYAWPGAEKSAIDNTFSGSKMFERTSDFCLTGNYPVSDDILTIIFWYLYCQAGCRHLNFTPTWFLVSHCCLCYNFKKEVRQNAKLCRPSDRREIR